jgi:predicted transport protein
MSDKLDAAARTMIDNLEKNTGKSLAQWAALVRETTLTKHGEMVKYLKSEHGLTHGYANMIALKARETADAPTTTDDLVESQYQGKETLRPIYDALATAVAQFGDDVEIAPKKAYVSLRRNKQFGLIQPSTKTRLDVGLNLGDAAADGRLEQSGSFNSMVSHRVRLSQVGEVDEELIGWLRQAYEAA